MLDYLKRLLNRFLDLFKKRDDKYQTLNEKLLNDNNYSLDSEIEENNISL
jgi:hypothetical protein